MNLNLKISEIKKGIYLCLENAHELISDADILLSNERYSRVYSLSQFAIEELGKSYMLYEFYTKLQLGKRREIDFNDFKKKFKSHKHKTFESMMADITMPSIEKNNDFEKFAINNFREIHKIKKGVYDDLKNESLYVSLNNNKFKKPAEILEREFVNDYFEKAKKKIEYSENWILKFIKQDEHFGTDKEGIINHIK